jgi:hypothetical protein
MLESREATNKKTRRLRKSPPTRRLPMRWGELPHQELYQRALNAMALGSRERAGEDSLKHVLKHRLPDLDYDDHRRYIEIECCKIVEMLRVVRDEYRRYLEKEGCKPIAEVYWVVYRFGVIQYAVRLLREVASEYVDNTKVPFAQWEILYGSCFLPTFTIARDLSVPESPKSPSLESVKDVIQGLIREETFEHVLDGGPFGREGQLYLTRQNPSFDFWGHGVDLFKPGAIAQVLRYRQTLTRNFDSLGSESPNRLTLGEPRCIVIAGLSSKLSTQVMRENFELQRERVRGVTVLTFDELFRRIERLVSLLEGRS